MSFFEQGKYLASLKEEAETVGYIPPVLKPVTFKMNETALEVLDWFSEQTDMSRSSVVNEMVSHALASSVYEFCEGYLHQFGADTDEKSVLDEISHRIEKSNLSERARKLIIDAVVEKYL